MISSANVSHELKTPLTAIRGFAETLLGAEDIDVATSKRFLERIRDQTATLSALVSDLLALSRIESGDQALERLRTDLRAPVLESLRHLRPAADVKNLSIDMVYPSRPIVVVGDEEALRQAFTNLVDNAIKYSPEGGRVEVRLAVNGDHATFAVSDQGPGIPAGHHERIFERFYRVDKARSRRLGGTGLGLSIRQERRLRLRWVGRGRQHAGKGQRLHHGSAAG